MSFRDVRRRRDVLIGFGHVWFGWVGLGNNNDMGGMKELRMGSVE